MSSSRRSAAPARDVIRAVIYRRTSTERQGERVSPEAQLADCEAHARAHHYLIVAVYTDIERFRSQGRLVEPSGTRVDRPDFQRLLADGHAGKFDIILAWKEDRLYRGVKAAVLVDDLLEARGVRVELVKETFDRKMLFIKAAIGRIELDSIRERTEMGMRARVRSGLIHGGPVPAGYQAVKQSDGTAGSYVMIDAWRGIFADLGRMYVERLSFREIATRLGTDPRTGKPWQDHMVRFIIRNPFYRGWVAYGWQGGQPEFMVPGRHAAAWDAPTVAAIERELARRGGRHNGPRSRALLSGILRCGLCGQPMACGTSKPTGDTGYRWYGCSRPVLVRSGRWAGRRTHVANYINETKCLTLLSQQLGEMDAATVDAYLAAAATHLGGAAPDDGERQARLAEREGALRGKLADLAVGLDGVRHASPAATEAILTAITAAGKELDQVREELAEIGQRRRAAPDLGQAREVMLRLAARPDLKDYPLGELQPLLQAAFPALFFAGGKFVPPVEVWVD